MSRVFVLLLVLSVAACDSSPTVPTENPVPLTVTRLTSDPAPLTQYSGYREQTRLVIRDVETWRQVWVTIFNPSITSLPPPLPVVDFATDMVVLAALGEQRTGGYSIAITAAEETSNGVTVRINAILPGAGCGVTQALTQPVDAVRISRRTSSVVFAERRETVECR